MVFPTSYKKKLKHGNVKKNTRLNHATLPTLIETTSQWMQLLQNLKLDDSILIACSWPNLQGLVTQFRRRGDCGAEKMCILPCWMSALLSNSAGTLRGSWTVNIRGKSMYFDSNDLAGTMDPPASIDLQAGGLRFEVFRKIEGNPGGKRYSKFDWKVLRLHIFAWDRNFQIFCKQLQNFYCLFCHCYTPKVHTQNNNILYQISKWRNWGEERGGIAGKLQKVQRELQKNCSVEHWGNCGNSMKSGSPKLLPPLPGHLPPGGGAVVYRGGVHLLVPCHLWFCGAG